MTYSRAGHNPPRLARRGRDLSLEDDGGLPLGIVDGQTYQQSSVTLERGDLLLLYTDGITEAMAPVVPGAKSRELFGVERLDALLLDCGGGSADGCIGRVRSELAGFTHDAPPTDDQTM